jgi:CubicO group peptidase (beta-lactamase class C family)
LTSKVTFRDLLAHRTGLRDKDELWTSGELKARGILRHIDELEVAGPLREHFEYNNVLYIAVAEMVSDLSGRSWTAIARERLLTAIGMARTGFSVEELLQSDEFSYSFAEIDGELRANTFPGPEHNSWFFARGSGSMFSNVDDMTRWMAFQLSVGVAVTDSVISNEIIHTTHAPQVRIDEPPSYLSFDGISNHAYGLGWYLDSYRGHQRIHHGGASMGFSNYITLFPEDRIGVVILSNRQVMMPVELMYLASDVLLGLAPQPWSARFSKFVPPRPRR